VVCQGDAVIQAYFGPKLDDVHMWRVYRWKGGRGFVNINLENNDRRDCVSRVMVAEATGEGHTTGSQQAAERMRQVEAVGTKIGRILFGYVVKLISVMARAYFGKFSCERSLFSVIGPTNKGSTGGLSFRGYSAIFSGVPRPCHPLPNGAGSFRINVKPRNPTYHPTHQHFQHLHKSTSTANYLSSCHHGHQF